MLRVATTGRTRWVRTLPLLTVLAVLVVSTVPAGAVSIAAHPAPIAGHLAAPAPVAHSTKTVATPASRSSISAAASSARYPLASQPSFTPSGVSLKFFQNNSTFTHIPVSQRGCTVNNYGFDIQTTCREGAYDPSAVRLANNNIGVGYTIDTNVTGTSTSGCLNGTTNTTVQERVGWSVSTDNGSTFGAIKFLGNESCKYLDAIEPSFAVGPSGTVYGVYVQENFSGPTGLYTDNISTYRSIYVTPHANRSTDSIGFTWSTDNGVTWHTPVTISTAGWIAHPQLVVSGNSLYVLYENIDNSTSGTQIAYGYGYTYYDGWPIALELLNSSNGGTSWSGPHSVPGIVGTSGIAQEMGGAIAVNRTGTVAVSYFTNDSCGATYYGCEETALDLVFSTTTTNGTSWVGPHTITHAMGTTPYYWAPYFGNYWGNNFNSLPESTLAFSPNGGTVYVAWTSPFNQTTLFGTVLPPYEVYQGVSGAFEATGSVAGTGFGVNVLMASGAYYPDQYAYSPAIEANAGGVYLTYSAFNNSYCSPFSFPPCPYTGGAFFQVVQTSPNGLTWTSPSYPTFTTVGGSPYNAANDYPGTYNSAVFTSVGAPLYVYALPQPETATYDFSTTPYLYNYTDPTNLFIAGNYTGSTVSVDIRESGVASGSPWAVTVDGSTIHVPSGVVNFTLGGIAKGQTVVFVAPQLAVVALEIAQGVIGMSGVVSYEGAAQFQNSNATVYVNFTYEFGLNIVTEPSNPFYIDVYEVAPNPYTDQFYIDNYCTPACTGYFPSTPPWYFAQGTTITFAGYGTPLNAQLWTGIGNGSSTAAGYEVNITMNGPITETAWFTAIGEYNFTVAAPTIPSTSTYTFALDGKTHSASGGSTVSVPNVATGGHYFTNVSATSSTAGWEYVGTAADTLPVLVPNTLLYNLSFAYEDLATPAGNVSFKAQGFAMGTPWQFTFNGTSYSSLTPWINISKVHTGTYTTAASPAVASNGTVGYLPNAVPSTWSVTTGSTYTVNFSQAYRIDAVAGTGGSIAGPLSGAFWELPGASVTLNASAHSGYSFGGWTGTGLGSYTGPGVGTGLSAHLTANGPITETAAFFPLSNSRFNLTFHEAGLTAGTLWTAFVGGTGYSGTGASIVVGNLLACGMTGAFYNISVPTAYASGQGTRFVVSNTVPHSQCTTGSTVVSVTFSAQYFVGVQSTPGGYATATVGSKSTTTGLWVASGATVGLDAYVQPGYNFIGWNGSGPGNYSGTLQIDTIVIAGPVLEVAAFAVPIHPPPPTYWITFDLATPLATGTAWTVTVGPGSYTSTGSSLVVSGLAPGTYALGYSPAYSPDGQTKYAPVGNPTSVSLSTNKTLSVGYTTSYWVTITAGSGGMINLPVVGSQSAWWQSGATITMNATANAGYMFVGWTGTGNGQYTGSAGTTTVVVRGPIAEVASFEPIPSQTGGSTTSTSSSFFAQPIAWIGLGLVGLLVGLVVGLMVSRRGRSPPPAAAAPVEAAPPSDVYGTPPPGGDGSGGTP